MEKTQIPNRAEEDEFQEWLQTLPKMPLPNGSAFYLYKDRVWCPDITLRRIHAFENHFQALDTDVFLSTPLKSGTTWLKALAFSVLHRTRYSIEEHPLTTRNPHDLVPLVEFNDVVSPGEADQPEDRPSPRIIGTHLPYETMPPSVRNSNCKIVCMCRNPLDVFVSYWHFAVNFSPDISTKSSIEEQFDFFFRGFHAFGPLWEVMLGYWKVSQERPDKVLLLKYEDMKKDTVSNVKKIAEFLGVPFSSEEENGGVIEEIIKLCSFESLKEMDVNKIGRHRTISLPNHAYFRKGQVGDWKNHISPEMAERAKKIIQEKFWESGLIFDM